MKKSSNLNKKCGTKPKNNKSVTLSVKGHKNSKKMVKKVSKIENKNDKGSIRKWLKSPRTKADTEVEVEAKDELETSSKLDINDTGNETPVPLRIELCRDKLRDKFDHKQTDLEGSSKAADSHISATKVVEKDVVSSQIVVSSPNFVNLNTELASNDLKQVEHCGGLNGALYDSGQTGLHKKDRI